MSAPQLARCRAENGSWQNIHHIRISTDIEINAGVKPGRLFLQQASI